MTLVRDPDAEKHIGLRCHCGAQIDEGWEWYTFERGIDPETKELRQATTTVRTCGTGCEVELRLLENEAVLARIRIKIDWIADPIEDPPERLGARRAGSTRS